MLFAPRCDTTYVVLLRILWGVCPEAEKAKASSRVGYVSRNLFRQNLSSGEHVTEGVRLVIPKKVGFFFLLLTRLASVPQLLHGFVVLICRAKNGVYFEVIVLVGTSFEMFNFCHGA